MQDLPDLQVPVDRPDPEGSQDPPVKQERGVKRENRDLQDLKEREAKLALQVPRDLRAPQAEGREERSVFQVQQGLQELQALLDHPEQGEKTGRGESLALVDPQVCHASHPIGNSGE